MARMGTETWEIELTTIQTICARINILERYAEDRTTTDSTDGTRMDTETMNISVDQCNQWEYMSLERARMSKHIRVHARAIYI